MEKHQDNLKLKKFYTMVMIIMPSILLVIVSMGMTEFLTRTMAQLILFALQYLVVKGVIDDYYSE